MASKTVAAGVEPKAVAPRVDSKTVAAAGRKVLAAMAELGYPVDAKVDFQYDADLRSMGHSRPITGGYRVVAAKGAMQERLLMTLLAHELSHVQRMSSGHPSHSNAAIQAAYEGLRLDGPQKPYHDEILHDVINDIEDLYADSIAFEVIQHLDAVPPGGVGGFFLAWMKPEPDTAHDAREQRWRAAHAMVGNARALAQIKVHGTPQQLREAKRINLQLRGAVPPDVAKAQSWFQVFLDDLPEDLTEKGFARSLAQYVQRFVSVAEGASSVKQNGRSGTAR